MRSLLVCTLQANPRPDHAMITGDYGPDLSHHCLAG